MGFSSDISYCFSRIVRSVRANQWIVSGKKFDAEELDKITLKTFQHTAYCLYDLYHNLDNPDGILQRVALSPQLKKFLAERANGKEGAVLVTPHLSNFDLAGRAMALHGYRIQVLSYPQPSGGYQWQNKLRMVYNIEITPMSTSTLRQAKKRLNDGGVVLTGVDRPLERSNYHPKFFGCPSMVPVTYIRLALQTKSPVVVVACVSNEDNTYTIDCSNPIYLRAYQDPVTELEKNAERVLKETENFIIKNPHQWSMFYPVWPQVMEQIP
jgi:KDO2-lipid IV(A) lauroyltransferase